MKGLLRLIFSRPFRLAVPILIQLWFIIFVVYRLSESFIELYILFTVLSYIFAIKVVNSKANPSYKIAWVIIILGVPMIGGVMYLLFGNKKIPKSLQSSAVKITSQTIPLFQQDESVIKEIEALDKDVYKQVNYIWNNAYYPVYKHNETQYFPTGEASFAMMLKELEKASRFIFLEYFIVSTGYMLNAVLAILKRKAAEGVQVRILYDDFGSMTSLPENFAKNMAKLNIEVHAFNKLRPILAIQMNNRDHRKICVIDGILGFVGGFNLADEYINRKVRFGHWKDSAIMIRGDAVFSLTIMFLQFFNYESSINDNYLDYRYNDEDLLDIQGEGYVQPFSDSPTDEEATGYSTHINMITQAHDYLYIYTPYLIIDDAMINALCLAAKDGVDIRIVTPHIPDKWYVHMVTRSNYQILIENGVKIYEYTKGFIHSKMMISDDELAIIGTTNMDFRSYYLHHECGVFLYKTRSVLKMKEDYLETLKECQQITYQQCLEVGFFTRVVQSFLNLFGPML